MAPFAAFNIYNIFLLCFPVLGFLCVFLLCPLHGFQLFCLGSTSLGHGIAIPHCRLANIEKAAGALITLRQGVDFDNIEKEPIDIIFALMIPENATEEHLQLLASIAEIMHSKDFRDKLRQAADNLKLFEIATHYHDEY